MASIVLNPIGRICWHAPIHYPQWTQQAKVMSLLKRLGCFGAHIQWDSYFKDSLCPRLDEKDLIVVRGASELGEIYVSGPTDLHICKVMSEDIREQTIVYPPDSQPAKDFVEELEKDRVFEKNIEKVLSSISFQKCKEELLLAPYAYQKLYDPNDKLAQFLQGAGKELYEQLLKLHGGDAQGALLGLQYARELIYLRSDPRRMGEPIDHYLKRLREKAFDQGLGAQPWIDATAAIWKRMGLLDLPTQSKMSRP